MIDTDDSPTTLSRIVHRVRKRVYESLIAGITFSFPLVVILIALKIVLDFALKTFKPVGIVVNTIWPGQLTDPIAEVVAIATLLAAVFILGFVTETVPSARLINGFHSLIGTIPGIGTVYLSIRRMSDTLFQDKTRIFREVKLVEYPNEGIYSFGFLTGQAPDVIEESTANEEMQTLFMPFAPNPILSGRVIYVPEDDIYDTDMTVEEATHTLVTSGVIQSEDNLTDYPAEKEPEID